MQDIVPVFRVSSGDSIFEDYRSKDGDEARIYTISTEMSNPFGAVSPQNENVRFVQSRIVRFSKGREAR